MRRHAAAASAGGCPCGSGQDYAQCCGPLHEGAPAASAEALMRSRYSAYALRLLPYLLQSWDASTRPALSDADLDPATRWLGLRIVAYELESADADIAFVEFIARWRVGGGRAQRLHERSRFRRVGGHWRYVDGQMFGEVPRNDGR
jgi:SEC-C motif-containing protein